MPNKDIRTKTATTKGKDQGYELVMFRNEKGIAQNARVLGQGTSSGLKLLVGSGPYRRIIDNVAAASGMKQTSVYFYRHQ